MVKKRTPAAKIAVLTVGSITLLAAVAAVVYMARQPTIDQRTGCPTEPGFTRVSLSITLDATDAYGPAQRETIGNRVWERVDALDARDRVKIYTIKPGEQAPLLNLCKPGLNLQDSPVEQRLQELRFKQTIDEALEELQGTRPNSPMIEALGWVAADDERDGADRRILLVSDLIEYSDVLNQYDPNWMDVYERDRMRIHAQCPNLDGVAVQILLATRPARSTQDNDLAVWWLDYLQACGGRLSGGDVLIRITGTG